MVENLLYLDPLNASFRLGDFLLLENKHICQVISLREKHTIVLLTNKASIKENLIKEYQIVKNESEGSLSQIKGKIIDSDGKFLQIVEDSEKLSSESVDLQKLLYNSNLTAKLTKQYKPRKQVEDALFTGTLIVDYGCPLYKGNFHLLNGKPKTGKKSFLKNVCLNFMREVQKVKRDKQLIYVTYSRSQAVNLKKQLQEGNLHNYK
jgi:F0F1-type ATP synthase alpha subunit